MKKAIITLILVASSCITVKKVNVVLVVDSEKKKEFTDIVTVNDSTRKAERPRIFKNLFRRHKHQHK